MIVFTALTALLYPALILPFQDLTLLGHADFFRVGIGIPAAFSFLFGPAAAWGSAIGNVVYDATSSGLSYMSIYGFVGNFVIGYFPYKLWSAVTSEQPDLKTPRKLALFAGITLVPCVICGLIIDWGLLWLHQIPFMPTAAIIALTDACWAIAIGAVVLALSHGWVSKHKLTYQDLLHMPPAKPAWNTRRTVALAIFAVLAGACFAIGQFIVVGPFVIPTIAVIAIFVVTYTWR